MRHRDGNFSEKICYLANQAYGSRLGSRNYHLNSLATLRCWNCTPLLEQCSVRVNSKFSLNRWKIRGFLRCSNRSAKMEVTKNSKGTSNISVFWISPQCAKRNCSRIPFNKLDCLWTIRQRFKSVVEDILQNCLHLCVGTCFILISFSPFSVSHVSRTMQIWIFISFMSFSYGNVVGMC